MANEPHPSDYERLLAKSMANQGETVITDCSSKLPEILRGIRCKVEK